MATEKKKRGAPASASKPVRPSSKHTPKDFHARVGKTGGRSKDPAVRAAKLAAFNKAQTEIIARIKAERAKVEPPTEPFAFGSGGGEIKYTDALDAKLMELFSNAYTIDEVDEMPGMPSRSVLLTWLAMVDHPFSKTYLAAKAKLVPLYEERALTAATKPLIGEVVTTKEDVLGSTIEIRKVDNVARSTLIFNAYQWSLSHLKPKKHGKKPDDGANAPNEQLKALFDSLKAGPKDSSV